MSKTLLLMGNGPSVKDVDFAKLKSSNIDTFGLNAAYRIYEKLDWYPTYFGCFDYIVTDSHKENFQELINNSPIQKFFFIRDYFTGGKFNYCNLRGGDFITNPLSKNFDIFYDNGNSGVNACQVAMLLGYTKILLIGIDQNYTEVVEGATPSPSGGLVMESTPNDNPNYWFSDYQREGDRYNYPQLHSYQTPAWQALSIKIRNKNLEIINCSSISTLECFPKSTLEKEIYNL
jgi:hypothetical protein